MNFVRKRMRFVWHARILTTNPPSPIMV
jgi:hypothetical protein